MNLGQLADLIRLCAMGSPHVEVFRKAVQCAQDSLHILGGREEIKQIIGRMAVGDFTEAPNTVRRFLKHPLNPPLENFHFQYLEDKSYLSFYRNLERDGQGKIRLLDGYVIKSFHLDMYECQ